LVIGCLEFIALLLAGFAVSIIWVVPARDRDVLWYLLSAMLILIGVIQVTAFGLYRGYSWARGAALGILGLSVPSLALPAAVLGLLVLLDAKTWNEYRAQRARPAAPADSGGPKG